MSYIKKPRIAHSKAPRNALGLSLRDYEGGMSTLCAGCGHDSVTAAIIQAFFELSIEPHRVAKMSGIGCSSKTPAYFLSQSHGINTVHGRMPSVATGANAANGGLYYIGISGDGDSLSIGLGQFAHALRRNLNMTYIIENNGVYGLTKGQFSASADIGSKAKKGDVNRQPPIDPVMTAITLGGTYVARGFSGDKAQLVPLLKGALQHRGFALVDVISPCVTFNDHEDSTKSYAHTRQHYHPVIHADFVPPAQAIVVDYEDGESTPVVLHDGSRIVLRKVDPSYDPSQRSSALAFLESQQAQGEVITGLLYVDKEQPDLHELNHSDQHTLNAVPQQQWHPGADGLQKILKRYA